MSSFSSTTVDVREAKARWVIENFRFLKQQTPPQGNIKSEVVFKLGAFQFCWSLFPRREEGNATVGLYLKRVDKNAAPAVAEYEYRIVNQLDKGDEVNNSQKPYTFVTEGKESVWGCRDMIALSVLEDEKQGFKQNDRIVVEGWVRVALGARSTIQEPPEAAHRGLVTDLKELLRSGRGADVTLVCGEVETRCHSLLLGLRSRVFGRMLEAGMTEASARKVVIDDLEPEAVQWLVRYLYTDELETAVASDEDALCHLLQAAHKYEVASLCERCEELISRALTVENVAERLSFADTYERPVLRAACLAYITRTPTVLEEVQATEAFERLSEHRPKLLRDILAASSRPGNGGGTGGARKRKNAIEMEFADGSEWSRLTLSSLRRACRERSLAESGTKQALRDRLEALETA